MGGVRFIALELLFYDFLVLVLVLFLFFPMCVTDAIGCGCLRVCAVGCVLRLLRGVIGSDEGRVKSVRQGLIILRIVHAYFQEIGADGWVSVTLGEQEAETSCKKNKENPWESRRVSMSGLQTDQPRPAAHAFVPHNRL